MLEKPYNSIQAKKDPTNSQFHTATKHVKPMQTQNIVPKLFISSLKKEFTVSKEPWSKLQTVSGMFRYKTEGTSMRGYMICYHTAYELRPLSKD